MAKYGNSFNHKQLWRMIQIAEIYPAEQIKVCDAFEIHSRSGSGEVGLGGSPASANTLTEPRRRG